MLLVVVLQRGGLLMQVVLIETMAVLNEEHMRRQQAIQYFWGVDFLISLSSRWLPRRACRGDRRALDYL